MPETLNDAEPGLFDGDPLGALPSLGEPSGEAVPADAASRLAAPRPRPRRTSSQAARGTSGLVSTEDPVVTSLLRIEGLLRTLVRISMRSVMDEELKEPAARAIYEATGDHTAREIAAAAGIGVGTVSRTWSRWETMGLVVKDGTRYRRAF
jgi:hypothetical protein